MISRFFILYPIFKIRLKNSSLTFEKVFINGIYCRRKCGSRKLDYNKLEKKNAIAGRSG